MTLFFYLFASLISLSSILVVASKNSVHSVLWLIFAFCNAAGLMVLLGAEFIAMMLIIIYVGAVAILFLFVVMMLDANFAELKGRLKQNPLLASLIAAIMFADIVFIIMLGRDSIPTTAPQNLNNFTKITNVEAISQVLYTKYVLQFQIAGLILFVAMVACISLTMRIRKGVKRQDVGMQLAKNKSNSIILTEVVQNSGVKGLKYNE